MVDAILNLLATSGIQGISPANTTFTTSLPSVLANMPVGTLIRGFVLNRDAKGNPILRTPNGDFLVESKFFLKIGSDVVVRVGASGQRLQASIISVDGHSPQEAENIPAHHEAGDVVVRSGQPASQRADANAASAGRSANTQATAERAPVQREAATLTGTLTRPAPTQPQAQPGQPALPQNLPAGSSLTFKLLTIAAPPNAPQQAQAFTAALPQAPPQQPASQPQAAPPSLLGQLYSAYTKVTGGQSATPPTVTVQAPVSFPAQMVQTPDAPEPLLQTPLGLVRLSNAANFAPGTRFTLELVPSSPLTGGGAVRSPATALAETWPTLIQIVDVLTQVDADAATRFLRLALPTVAYGSEPQWKNLYPDSRSLGSGMALFMNALGAGSMREWMGEKATRALEKAGHSMLLQKAEGEFSALRTLYHEAPPGQWQALFVPIMAEGELKQLRFYTKSGRKGRDRRKGKEGDTRFIVEFELSQTGPMQLDGFVRKRDGATQFDLVIRSHTAFTPEEQRDIQDIYSGIGEATGYTGLVQFQQVADFPVKPLEDIISQQHREVVV